MKELLEIIQIALRQYACIKAEKEKNYPWIDSNTLCTYRNNKPEQREKEQSQIHWFSEDGFYCLLHCFPAHTKYSHLKQIVIERRTK